MPISDTTRDEAQRLARRYPVARSALLPMLHLVQAEEGFVTDEGIALCAELLGLTKAEVQATSTFYTMFKREPVGTYLLSVCTNPTCKIAGAQTIYEDYVARCGGSHHTDEGAGVTVEHAECLGICDAAPVVQINYEMYGPVSHDEAMDLFEKAKAGDPPPSNWSNEVPGDFRTVQRQLSGIEDGTDEQLIAAARRQANAESPPAYRTGLTHLPVTHPGSDPLGHGGEAFAGQARFEGTDAGRPTPADVSAQEADLLEDVAAQTSGTEQELADQATRPTPPSPPAEEQGEVPPTSGTASAPTTSGEQTAAGTEAEPSSAPAGEDGSPPDDPPTDLSPDVEPGVDGGAERSEHARRQSSDGGGEPTGQGDPNLRTYEGERREDGETTQRLNDEPDEEG